MSIASDRPPRGARPTNLIAYGVAVAIAITTTVFFGWAGWWLGLVVLVLVKMGLWGVPLIKLSYADERQDPEPKA